MGWFVSIVIAALTGVVSLFAGGFVMAAYCKWYRVSNFEGGAGYAMMAVALLSGIAGTVLGLVVARMRAADESAGFFGTLGVAVGIALAIALLALGIAWLLADIPPTIDGKRLNLEVEIKLPVGATSPLEGEGRSELTLGSVVNHTQRASQTGELRPKEARLEDGRWIVPGSVFLFTSRGLRSLGIEINGKEVQGFIVPLPGHPGREQLAWSGWGPQPRASDPPWPDTKPSYRFRVSMIEPPPEGPSQEDIDRLDAEAKQKEFEAMDPDAPVSAWLEWTRYGATDDQKAGAIARIETRATCAEELGVLMNDEDHELASEALRLISQLNAPPKGLVPELERTGRNIADLVRKFNEMKPEDETTLDAITDLSWRFSAWLDACRAVRTKCGGDFSNELGEILNLSRVRTDSQAMRSDVLRVASYWMQQWTGLAPLPTDPPPR